MAAKGGKTMPAGHTAGIFADMTLDGPEIGTLVAVIDRAKNLPNRRTMGKQDPYCAMRLGKEAKKTGTDKRGGQTPKWDQELRFTVHDSPDYYKLKCSVFNDDKKTDLIGEAWIDLTTVVVPGGGQNDLWHQLQFKGKYAGDVRMELTYYDTRPKDPVRTEKRRDKEQTEHTKQNSSSSGVAPRRLGPREVKRRPLPADPSTSASPSRPSPQGQVHSAPLPQLHQHDIKNHSHQDYDDQWGSDSQCPVPTSTGNSSFPELPPEKRLDSDPPAINDGYRQPQAALNSSFSAQQPMQYGDLARHGEFPDSDSFSVHSAQSSLPVTPAHPSSHGSYVVERYHSAQSPDTPPDRSSPYSLPAQYGSSPLPFTHDKSAPGLGNHQSQVSFRRFSTSPVKNDVFRDSPLRQSISQHDVEPALQPRYHSSEDEGPPPPPPAHRSNLQTSASPPDVPLDMQPVPMPQPLNLGSNSRRMSPFDRSPLQSIERNYDPLYSSEPSPPPSAEKDQLYSPYTKLIYSSPPYRTGASAQGGPTSGIENTPPSLRPGYGRGMEEKTDSWMLNTHDVKTQSMMHVESPRDREMDVVGSLYKPYQPPQVEDEGEAFASEPPFIKPRTVSPDLRTVPRRKAISLQSVERPGDQRLGGIPFGPDSYEVFNPSSPQSSTIAGPESRYETPEQAKEAARQHEVQKLRDQGPIIGNDGREIDPTDHLPTDTWAPEPERKSRKPEMVIRYKTKETTPRRPPGYGSSPGLARPHSIAGSAYGSSPLVFKTPPGSAQQNDGRNRLQKQMPGRPLPVQPYQQTHSSPAVPSANYNTPSPRTNYPTRPDLTEYSLCDQQNQRHSRGGSPGGPYDAGPPIPAKVPISTAGLNDRHAAYGGMDALSAELSTIDIGAGMGGRGARSRQGY
ncbi:hypothetical protein GJ744_000524 [Endocarpon pusillum]|uniref:C2 domain-containing protein n=1 Tax=Endocarpon pusillum TaxID=364733 RepID=A0A8H7E1V0_9EURO|nr:hypothetical protein GJ744_000524 [Endocarpon pusillum]